MRKSLANCKFIFLDTGVIIEVLKTDYANSSEEVVKRGQWVKRFFDCLLEKELFGTNKILQISALNISEIFHVDNYQEKTMEAITTFTNTTQLEVFAFDEHIALYHNKEFHNVLSKSEIEKIKNQVNYPASSYANIEDRIRKDMLIVATAKMYNADVVLTTDSGFKVLCDLHGVFCHCFTDDDNQFLTAEGNLELIYDFKS